MIDQRTELAVAIAAVRAAARVCRAVQHSLVRADTLEKKDKSPVTVADFASQAIVCEHLARAFGDDAIVAEEDAGELRESGNEELCTSLAGHVSGALGQDVSVEQVLDWIDRGSAGAGSERYWTLDPIDGTKGFLRQEQYAVALALIEDGEVVLGVLGCPNLPRGSADQGALFAAQRGGRTRMFPLVEGESTGEDVAVAPVSSLAEARFCESVESAHSDHGEAAEIARLLGITAEPYRIDSQCKYAAVARGDASIYLRMPTREDYREKIWDHAAGKLVVEAAGGRVTDIHGNSLDFRHGRMLEHNRGIVATNGAFHDEVIGAVARVRG